MIVMAFTGCLFMEKAATLVVEGKTEVSFGSAQPFEVKMTSSSAGGVGDVFAKDAEVKSVKWDFKNTTHSEGSFSQTLTGDAGRKISPSFTTAPGAYELIVTITTTADNVHNKKYNFVVVKAAPTVTVIPKMSDAQITWNSVEKNDDVDMFITIQDSQINEAQLNDYSAKWKVTHDGTMDSSDFAKYGDSKKYTYEFTVKTAYTVALEIVGPFGDVYNVSVRSFTITTAKPEKPILVGTPAWNTNGSKFEIEVQKGSDVLYYEMLKKSVDSEQYYFVYRAFVGSASTVKLFDSNVTGSEVTYKIYGVDGGQSMGTPLETTLEIPNRPPSKASIISPLGMITGVVDFGKPLLMYWTNGQDNDLGDTVRYDAFIGESRESLGHFLGTTVQTNRTITKQLVSGNTYYLRVDSFDTQNKTYGDVYSFTFDPQTIVPVVDSARLDTTTNPYKLDILNYTDANNAVIPANYQRIFEIELSRYASFNDSKKFKITKYSTLNLPIDVPSYAYDGNGKMFVRIRITYENAYMKVTTKWSNASAVTIR
jgi:hypothetical protein